MGKTGPIDWNIRVFKYTSTVVLSFVHVGLIYSLEEDMREAVSDLKAAVTVP